MSCLSWRDIFHESWENKSKFQMGGLRETGGLLLFSPEERTYSPPRRGGGTCRWQAVRFARRMRLLRQPPGNATAPTGAAVIVCAIGQIPSLQPTLFFQPPAQTCHRQLCRRDGRAFCPSIFSFTKEKQKKENEVNERWQFTIWKRRWSAGAQGALLWPPPLI